MPSELLDPRARIADLPSRRIGRNGREAVERLVIGVTEAGAGIIVELREKPFEVVVEILEPVEHRSLSESDRLGEIRVDVSDIGRDRPKRFVIGAGDSGVVVELGEHRIEIVDALLDDVGEIVLVVATISHSIERA